MVMAGNEDTSGSMVENSSSRLQWLKQRRIALQDKLMEKNSELKTLCIEEAELTGILPPEIPLEPGESPPLFRRRAATSYFTESNTFNKFPQTGTEESSLELERQVQVGIMENSLGVINDSNESKSMRRKHRQIYQQTQRRLQELDARLNFVRQSHGKSNRQTSSQLKHRMKKPRPPLNGNEEDPIGLERKSQTYNVIEEQANASPISQHKHMKPVEYDHNENHNIYILPDQQSRIRTYSHGSTNTLQNHYRTMDEPKIQHYPQKPPYASYNKYHSDDSSKTKELCTLYSTYSPEYQIHCKNHLSSPICHKGNTESYWIRPNETEIEPQQQQQTDRFGSLDRRRQINVPYSVSPNTDIRYHKTITRVQPPTIGHYPSFPLTEQTSSSNNRILIRTQSLGSVESWHVNPNQDSHDHPKSTKEKHWYETSLDYDLAVVEKNDTSSSSASSVHNNTNKVLFHQHKLPIEQQQNHYSRVELNIPQEIDEEKIQSFETSNNCCTIIQAGKYQPYREVTKPFEMSDFYKYSTKFRKKITSNGQQGGSMESNTTDHTQKRVHQPYLNGLR